MHLDLDAASQLSNRRSTLLVLVPRAGGARISPSQIASTPLLARFRVRSTPIFASGLLARWSDRSEREPDRPTPSAAQLCGLLSAGFLISHLPHSPLPSQPNTTFADMSNAITSPQTLHARRLANADSSDTPAPACPVLVLARGLIRRTRTGFRGQLGGTSCAACVSAQLLRAASDPFAHYPRFLKLYLGTVVRLPNMSYLGRSPNPTADSHRLGPLDRMLNSLLLQNTADSADLETRG